MVRLKFERSRRLSAVREIYLATRQTGVLDLVAAAYMHILHILQQVISLLFDHWTSLVCLPRMMVPQDRGALVTSSKELSIITSLFVNLQLL